MRERLFEIPTYRNFILSASRKPLGTGVAIASGFYIPLTIWFKLYVRILNRIIGIFKLYPNFFL
jgi:hypothetical protein